MIITYLLLIGFAYYLCRSFITNIIDRTEDKHIANLHLEEKCTHILSSIETEFPNHFPRLRNNCKELFNHAFTIIPRLNKYTSLRNIKNSRYVH